jgi:hypothetical protein
MRGAEISLPDEGGGDAEDEADDDAEPDAEDADEDEDGSSGVLVGFQPRGGASDHTMTPPRVLPPATNRPDGEPSNALRVRRWSKRVNNQRDKLRIKSRETGG